MVVIDLKESKGLKGAVARLNRQLDIKRSRCGVKKKAVQQETRDKADSLDLVILRSPSKPFSSQIQCHENGTASDE
jgi:hypothetical protein